MSQWSYQREESNRLSPGDYRVSIVDVQETTSKSSGNPMLVITVQPNGSNIKIQNYIVRNEYWNRNLTQFYDSFNVPEGNLNFMEWINAVGAARLKEDEQGYLKIAWFIDKKKAEKLPPWVGEVPERQTVTELEGGFQKIDGDDDLPF